MSIDWKASTRISKELRDLRAENERLKARVQELDSALLRESCTPEQPLPMESAPRDGTMVRLLVDFTEHATEDSAEPCWTIGANNDDNVLHDERVGWQFAGWCWNHDHFTEGEGTPVGWLPMLATQPRNPT